MVEPISAGGIKQNHTKCDTIWINIEEPNSPSDRASPAGRQAGTLPQISTRFLLTAGKRPKLPSVNITFKAAQHTGKKKVNQEALEL
ncbi:MAG: hypothetical protein NTX44_00300 [Ignavibacteriales bacterium]|nr:hypothetical protein [Ignavibacteriales bacterium]